MLQLAFNQCSGYNILTVILTDIQTSLIHSSAIHEYHCLLLIKYQNGLVLQ
jgi:hypothetical protein